MCKNACSLSKDAVIVNDLGLHARSAAKIAELARKAKSKVWLQKGDDRVDAKSMIDILTLACEKGTAIRILVEAPADVDTLDRIAALFMNGFGE